MGTLNLIEVFSILIIHFISDFVIQTHWQATNKSKNNKALTMHVLTNTLVWTVVCCIYAVATHNYMMLLLFPIINFICHWFTDYLTSRLNTYLWNKGDIHNFFVSIGFDQILHYLQLFITYQLLK